MPAFCQLRVLAYLRLQLIIAIAWISAGCVYIPIATEMQPGKFDRPHIDELIGETLDVVEFHFGLPVVKFKDRGNQYVIYRFTGEHEYVMAGLLPFYLPIPFADKVTEEVNSCVLLKFDAEKRLDSYEISDWSWSRRCIKRFWDRGETAQLESSLMQAAVGGDTDAALTLVEEFGVDRHGSVSQRLREAAEQGNVKAALKLQEIFGEWEPLKKLARTDDDAAQEMERLFASRPALGGGEAQFQLYLSLRNDSYFAHRWLCSAADQSHPPAQYQIGTLYQFGAEGLPQDDVFAFAWFTKASIGGHIAAKHAATAAASRMTEADKQRAKRK